MLTLNPHLSWIYSPAPLLAGAGTECRLRATVLPASSARYPDSIRSIHKQIRRRPREYNASLHKGGGTNVPEGFSILCNRTATAAYILSS